VDNGLLRLNEAQQVMDMFGDHFGLNIVHVEGEQRFLTRWQARTIRKPNVKSSAACSLKCSTKKR
jgi:GMP synthase PP-ATPase subunit